MSELQIDTATLRGVASSLRGIADAVPKTQVIDLAAAGSASVANAAESLNMWAAVTGLMLAGKIDQLAGVADSAATQFELADEAAADATVQP